jgi:signal transduction histidine kinase
MFLKSLENIRKNIGLKFTLWYSAIFILSSLGFFFLIYFSLSRSIQNKEIEKIQFELNECAIQYQKGGLKALAEEVEWEKNVLGINPFLVHLQGPYHQTLFINLPDGWKNVDLDQIKNTAVGSNNQWQLSTVNYDKEKFEVVSHSFPDGSVLKIGKSLSESHVFLKQFRSIFVFVLLPMLVIGFMGGGLLAFRTLRPLRYLRDTTRSILSTNRLDIRIPATRSRDELEDLSMLFNSMMEKIETLINGMKMVLDNVAHDLRTPMTRLRGSAELALQGEQNIHNLREALLDCLEESEQALAMLNTLMDISEAETGTMKLNPDEINLPYLINEVVDLYCYIAEDKKILIETHMPKELYITADANRLRQVLSNLLDNALKYTPGGGKIDIKAFQKDRQISIVIKDTGIGIPPEELTRIWDRLYRVDKSRSQPGLGLGLSLVKAVVRAHKGHVEVSSKPNEGSSFTVFLHKNI